MAATLVYKNGLTTGATGFLAILDALLINVFNSGPVEPRGLGWNRIFNSNAGTNTALSAGINNTIATISVSSTAGFQVPGTILIDSEQISYSGVTLTSFTGCLRGINGTTAVTHLNSAVVSSVSDKMYSSLGFSQSERILFRLTASEDDTYLDRQICQLARTSDGYMLNAMGATSATKIVLGAAQFEYWIVGNQDFFHLVTLVGSTYSHYYCGIINRFAPNQNSSIYGQSAPVPVNTTVPDPTPFTVATGTTLFLRTGFDAYGGYSADNLSFVPGQKLYIIDQSLGTSTVGHQGIVVLNSVNTIQNTINVTYVSGNNTFSSFAIIGIDPQPIALNSNGVVRGSSFIMLDDYVGDPAPQFNAIDEFSSLDVNLPPESIQNPDIRGVYITYPIRLSNTEEIRGTLYGMIDTPLGAPGAQDLFQTFDQLYRFIVFPDGSNHMIAIGSII